MAPPIKLLFSAFALVVGALIFWYAIDVILLGFAAILLAIFLNTISQWVASLLHISYRWALAIVLIILTTLFTTLFWIAAPLIKDQLSALIEKLPGAYAEFKLRTSKYIDGWLFSGEQLSDKFIFKNEQFFHQITQVFSFTVGIIVSFVVFVFLGIYLALAPVLYIEGFLRIVPQRHRLKIVGVIARAAHALRWWIFGKCISMTAIFILTMIGLWLLKMPLAFILGLLAGVFTFIPYIGAILTSIPAILIALSISPLLALWVIILYLVIHAIEGYLITPFIEQKTVFLPPALTVITQVMLALLIGFIGLALTSPLLVVILILIQELYIKRERRTFT